jgi:hypothetical protein
VDRVEETLAQWPIPRLQRPYAPFLYEFSWSWEEEAGGWSVRKYRAGDRAITLFTGVGDALTALGPLLRPFIMRWWTEKAAQLNPDVEDARSVLDFEDFLFRRNRVPPEQVAEGLLDLQQGRCFYCNANIGRQREIDHFVPGTTAATTAPITSSPSATAATTASARPSPGRTTSGHYYNETIRGTAT